MKRPTPFLVDAIFFLVVNAIAGQDTTYDACDNSQPGGAKCSCGTPSAAVDMTLYDCRIRSLTSVPTSYVKNTYEINLSNNKITQVEQGKFTNLRSLELLYLQANYINYIEPGAFNGLMSLRRIFLASNHLMNISNRVFEHLPALEEIYLSNNFIATVERYAFFTAPALKAIYMGNNKLVCGCEEKFFRQFLDIRVGILSLKDARCTNFANNAYLATADDSLFPACAGEHLFLENNVCFSCADVPGTKECAASGAANCTGKRDVCFTRVEYVNSHLGIWGGCSDYTSCMTHERANSQLCKQGVITQCHYCTLGRRSNNHDILNTVKRFEMIVTVTLDATLTSDLQDPTSLYRRNYETNFINQVNSLIYGTNGSFTVAVDDVRPPYVTVELSVNASTVWYVSKQEILTTINGTIGRHAYYLQGSPIISVQVILKEDAISFCLAEIIPDPTFGTFYWPQSKAGIVVFIPCPKQYSGGRVVTVARSCVRVSDGRARWGTAVINQCPPVNRIPSELQGLSSIRITDDNVEQVSANISSLSENWSTYTEHEISWTTEVIEGILKTTLVSTSRDVIQNTLQTVNNILFIGSSTLEDGENTYSTSSRLIRAMDGLLEGIDVSDSNFGEVKENMAGFVLKTDHDSFDGISLYTDVTEENPLTSGKVNIDDSDKPVEHEKSSIQIPASVFSSLPSRVRNSISKGTLSIYKESKIFDTTMPTPVPKEVLLENNETVLATRRINSHVIGASFPEADIRNLKEPVKVTFRHFKAAVEPECVFWEKTGAKGGRWINDGCTLTRSESDFTVCSCDHLTNFALLMDVYGSGGQLSDADKMALAVISYIGCGVSFVAMCLTIVTYLMFKKLRKENPGKILMNLCLAIGLADLVFVAGMQSYTSNSPAGCKVVAALLHFLLLAAMCWMAVEAFYMYLALVKVFDTYIARFQLKSSLFGWGVPFIIVILTLGINKTDNYGIQPGGICWLSRIAFYAAFLGPVVLIIIINSIVFIFVMKQIINRSSNKLTKIETSSTGVRLRGAVSVIILLGLTWVFAIFAVGDFGLVFHYLFAIFNSLQGLFIFFFYCFMKKDVRNLWKRKCSCFKSPYEVDSTTQSRDRGFSSSNSDQTVKTSTSNTQSQSETKHLTDRSGKVSPKGSPTLTKPQTAFRGTWQLQTSEPKKPNVNSPGALSYSDV